MKNKYQEALNEMYAVLNDSERWHEKKSLLQELVEKETPLKPYNIFNIKPNCRNCDAKLTTVENYCPNCGKKIDWSDE